MQAKANCCQSETTVIRNERTRLEICRLVIHLRSSAPGEAVESTLRMLKSGGTCSAFRSPWANRSQICACFLIRDSSLKRSILKKQKSRSYSEILWNEKGRSEAQSRPFLKHAQMAKTIKKEKETESTKRFPTPPSQMSLWSPGTPAAGGNSMGVAVWNTWQACEEFIREEHTHCTKQENE